MKKFNEANLSNIPFQRRVAKRKAGGESAAAVDAAVADESIPDFKRSLFADRKFERI